ncbi:hypothetical protein CGZ80_20495 [Rhodopirellula sp. MGV]|nr:hypothetical protein CGZ80_20495 [Rhodopirellula sp. MGV]PNY35186.1 hypothetical protein C2E31_20035 [Rhodopirellula baltica]
MNPHNKRSGIVLLIVLGMLSLFTVLVVSFVVFSSQMARTSAVNKLQKESEIPIDEAMTSIITKVISGTTNPRSALLGESLLEDLYGIDGLQLRVGHRRGAVTRTNLPLTPTIPGGMLLLPRSASGIPETTLFKFPTNLVQWFDDGATVLAASPGAQELSPVSTDQFHVQVRPDLDDVFAGRLVTFDAGPLAGVTFRVIRSFGNRMGEPPTARDANPEPRIFNTPAFQLPALTHADYNNASLYTVEEYNLSGCLVVDLSELESETVVVDSRSRSVYEIADLYPNALLYSPGPDGLPGVAYVDDDGDGVVDNASEYGWPSSDDYGYRFKVNGVPFNGRGKNPTALTGLLAANPLGAPVQVDLAADAELTLNPSLVPPTTRAGNAGGIGFLPEPDEQWDGAGLENLWLAWQPSDHRRVYNSTIYGGANAADLNRNLGSNVIPSFHRPSVVNYLMNAPIYLPGEDPTTAPTRTFFTIRNSPVFSTPEEDHRRLAYLVQRLRRAVPRPLNFSHFAFTNTNSDLNGDGIPFDGAPGFSGSNNVPILNLPIDLSRDISTAAGFQAVANDIERLAVWLVNGPWDVDNDGDGLPDSIWIDPGLSNVKAPDGTLIRPLVALLIEDMDGKVNLNYHGSYSHLAELTLVDGPIDTDGTGTPTARRLYNGANSFLSAATALDSFGFGGGIGPAEVNFLHLFSGIDPTANLPGSYPNTYNGALNVSQIALSQQRRQQLSLAFTARPIPWMSFDNVFTQRPADGTMGVLRSTYGNVLNLRYGGKLYDFLGNQVASYPAASETKFPAAGDYNAAGTLTSLMSRIPFPSRTPIGVVGTPTVPTVPYTNPGDAFNQYSPAGRPMDMAGVSKTRKSFSGHQQFSNPIVSNDVANQPYEFGSTEAYDDDAPFTAAEYIDFIEKGPLNGRLSELLSDAVTRNKAIRNLIATESRSLESPELPGESSFLQLLGSKLVLPGASSQIQLGFQQSHIDRMVAVELRKGQKLNLNRQLGNGQNDNPSNTNISMRYPALNQTDDYLETEVQQIAGTANATPNNRRSNERAFPQVGVANSDAAAYNANYSPQHYQQANYGSTDFDGLDTDGDGILDFGTQFDLDNDGNPDEYLKIATGEELLARHLYVLMFTLIMDANPTYDSATPYDITSTEFVPNFPYPSPGQFTNIEARNRYVARKLAQWAVNTVDYRDTNVACTRLRYDPNPFDGFDPVVAARNTVWGMERPELELTEAIAFHDKRLKRNLQETGTEADQIANDEDSNPSDALEPDFDMDQFRIPLASGYIELHSLRDPVSGGYLTANPPYIPANTRSGTAQESLPRELYTNGRLDLGRIAGGIVTVGGTNIDLRSPVWRIAVSEPTGNDHEKSTRWLFDAERIHHLGTSAGSGRGQIEEVRYLRSLNPGDWTSPADIDTALTDARDLWREGQKYSAEISNVPRPAIAGTEVVRLADGNFDPDVSGGANLHDVQLERFVWFAQLAPNDNSAPNGLEILRNIRGGGMRLNNVYFNRLDRQAPNDTTLAINATPQLAPGGYAVVGPRASTILGQTSDSNILSSPMYEYHPVNQRFEFALMGAGQFRLNYFGLNGTNPLTPRYIADNANAYHVKHVLPLICESLMPHETGATGTIAAGWNTYLSNNAGRTVDMGFNISAPLPGPLYYPAPTESILPTYPLTDGYADYDGTMGADPAPPPTNGSHPDVPFDHTGVDLDGNGSITIDEMRPMRSNTYDIEDTAGNTRTVFWNSIGTHQEVRTVFLQRLADPTKPWHAIDNPYLTEDFIPIDLTTYNGEADPTEQVDRDGNGMLDDNFVADQGRVVAGGLVNGTLFDGTDFTPRLAFDSRRKIPAVQKDRVSTQLVRSVGAADALGNYSRFEMVQRSPYSSTFSVLRSQAVVPGTAYWKYQIGSMWPDQNFTETGEKTARSIDTTFDLSDPGSTGFPNLTFDNPTSQFRQTLGFVNREYGYPIRSDGQFISVTQSGVPLIDPAYLSTDINGAFDFQVGQPQGVISSSLPWLNREFQSPMELMNVPATSRTGLLPTFTLGTRYIPAQTRELPDNFGHLLGFDRGFNFPGPDANGNSIDDDAETSSGPRYLLGTSQDQDNYRFESDVAKFSGRTAGFEQIFDFVDTGPVYFDSQRWIDPKKVIHRTDAQITGGSAVFQTRASYFNRVVTTLQPPYNYISKHRSPGKVNLNTTPDYVSKGPGFTIPNSFLDQGESPEQPQNAPAAPVYLSFNPNNDNVDEDGFTLEFRNSNLYANGSVYRALNWGSSTPYELDTYYGSPSTLGENNEYERSVDTSFGHSFKAFIESRRGYSNSARGTTELGNINLDWRYPTRFAGVFAPARSATLGSVQRFMRQEDETGRGVHRRTQDMGLLRPHPDFNMRLITNANRTLHQDETAGATTPYQLLVETDATEAAINNSDGSVNLADPASFAEANADASVGTLSMSMLRSRLFERPQAELHESYRGLDRDSYFKYQEASRLANLTSSHSNVFVVRMTASYFVVDPTTGALNEEYTNSTGEPLRRKNTYVIDRSIPVGFLPGRPSNSLNTIIYSEVQQ